MSKKPIRPERRKVRPPTSQEIKLVSCAVCQRDIVGPTHAEHAHTVGLAVAVKVLDRWYCPGCQSVGHKKQYTCTDCRKVCKAIGMDCQGGKYFCLACAELAPAPWRNIGGLEWLGTLRQNGSDQVEHFATENSK